MGLFESDKCISAYDYILDLDGGIGILCEMLDKIISKELTYYWSLPRSASKFKYYSKMFTDLFKIIHTSVDDSSSQKVQIMKKIYRQFKYLLGLPKELQKEVPANLRRKYIKIMEACEPYNKAPSPSPENKKISTETKTKTKTRAHTY